MNKVGGQQAQDTFVIHSSEQLILDAVALPTLRDMKRFDYLDRYSKSGISIDFQSLHTLEDLSAHSNWVELALIELGYTQVFPHVGSSTQIQIMGTNKRVWPLVTGTFGGVDFIHSLLGEATDHISQTSLTDLNAAISDAERHNSQELYDKLKGLLKMVPSASSDLDSIQQNSQALAGQGNTFHLQGQGGPGPALTAQEIAQLIYPILSLRDKIMKTVTTAIEKVHLGLINFYLHN